jgi:hypothetical protein
MWRKYLLGIWRNSQKNSPSFAHQAVACRFQQREGRWDWPTSRARPAHPHRGHPDLVKHGINAWMTAAGIEDGRLLRSVSKSGKVNRDTLSDCAVWSVVEQVVEQSSKQIGIEHFGAHDLRRPCARLCRKERRRPGAD